MVTYSYQGEGGNRVITLSCLTLAAMISCTAQPPPSTSAHDLVGHIRILATRIIRWTARHGFWAKRRSEMTANVLWDVLESPFPL
ncbi:unnamed protein product [Tuber melanosporum]|uniref:(Perigord truffle) hypothetical protein n=1 Tax=Tuber melanosporum (strain Mel28) TaxID=656061 RepID=D5GF13_TUBMM|nr:uncharacterized protein GSTUM_00006692001 [Tuber melanosporum]CAZ83106.1 unnamed protein product [Tuber melanosporum]